MRRNTIWAIATALIVAAGITFQVVGTTSHEVKDDAPTQGQTTEEPVAPDADIVETPPPTGDEREGETNDQSGKPGEGSKG
jgi:hypothetical protein